METTQHIIALQNGMVWLPQGEKPNNVAPTIQYALMEMGYMLSREAYDAVSLAPRDEAVRFHDEVVGYLRHMRGDNGVYVPLYNGFPQQVMSLTDVELFIDQILHYWSDGAFVPNAWTAERSMAFEHPTYAILRNGSQAEFEQLFTQLCAVNQSLSPTGRATVQWFAQHYPDAARLLPAEIPFKETLCVLAAADMPVTLATATDVLRLAVYLSGGDVALPPMPPKWIERYDWHGNRTREENPKRKQFRFTRFSRATRRKLLAWLEQSTCDPAEMALRAERWKRLGEQLHPGEYAELYPRAAAAFSALRNGAKSWYAQLMAVTDRRERIAFLAQRPGELVRRLDALLRAEKINNRDYIIEAFEQVLPRVSSKVLYELYNHFLRRTTGNVLRPLLLKGERKPRLLPSLRPMEHDTVTAILTRIEAELSRRYATLPPLGKTYIDERLRFIPVPLQMRGLNPSLKTRIRGTRIPISNTQARVLRFYLHWKDETGNEDLDLSATFIAKDKVEQVSWNSGLKTDYALHSGDVRHRKGDCAEYIDVDIAAAREQFRYVVVSAHNFDRRPMNSLDAAFGYMEREYPEANPIWVPSTAVESFRFVTEAQGVHMVAVDLWQMQYIVLDIDSTTLPIASLDVDSILSWIRLYTETPALDMYRLLLWHARARGTPVDAPEEAETRLDYEIFATQYMPILSYIV